MDDVRRRRPWWHWALGAFAGLVILSALFGDDGNEPAPQAKTVTVVAPGATTASTSPAGSAPALVAARAAADDGRYAEAVAIASKIDVGARDAIARRIANRIARRSLAALDAADLGKARARLGQAARFPTTALTRYARAGYRVARRRAAAKARRIREARTRRRAAVEPPATREQATEPSAPTSCDASYEGACLNPDSADYDCAGGSGNGPDYTGTVRVVGNDHFDLDRDGDGVGCQP
jgi:hypothetical protein